MRIMKEHKRVFLQMYNETGDNDEVVNNRKMAEVEDGKVHEKI